MRTEYLGATESETFYPYSPADVKILNLVHEMKFGTIEITIHNGQIVQVEKREKIRFDTQGQK